MSSNRTLLFPIFLLVLTAFLSVVDLARGAFFIGKHEGDMLHLVLILRRMASGDIPHLDFLTPVGDLAFLPIAALVRMGLPDGMAMLASQVVVAVLMLPALWRIGASRLPGGLSYLFAAVIIVLVLTLVPGADEQSVSFSMHYNRWAWAFSFLAVALALFQPQGPRWPVFDGILIGLCMAALALIKMTFFIGILPGICVALLGPRDARTLLVAGLTGLAVAAAFTLWHGPAFWLAYARDLLAVALSAERSYPGLPLIEILAAPRFLGGSLLALFAVVLLRQGERQTEGLALLILLPGFIYATYQNYTNDPVWIALLAIILFALRPPAGWASAMIPDLRFAATVGGWIAAAFIAPTLVNMAYAPLRHLNADADAYVAFLPHEPEAELYMSKPRALRFDAAYAMEDAIPQYRAAAGDYERKPGPTVFHGETLPDCQVLSGMPSILSLMAEDVAAAGYAGSRIYTADLINAAWVYADFQPLEGGSPWYYGGLPGFASADYLLVPLCPIFPPSRAAVLKAVEERDLPFHEVRRTDTYVLYAPGADPTAAMTR